MFTGSGHRAARWICLASAFLWTLPASVDAHPVAQGGLIVTISSSHVALRVTVTLEEVLVASAYGRESGQSKSATEAAERHGSYLVEHMRLFVDGRRLTGVKSPRRIQD